MLDTACVYMPRGCILASSSTCELLQPLPQASTTSYTSALCCAMLYVCKYRSCSSCRSCNYFLSVCGYFWSSHGVLTVFRKRTYIVAFLPSLHSHHFVFKMQSYRTCLRVLARRCLLPSFTSAPSSLSGLPSFSFKIHGQ